MALSLIPWFCAVAGIAFLAFCVRDNRKTGFRPDRSEVSLLQEGILWIEEVEAALSQAPQPRYSPVAAPASSIDGLKETLAGAQLMNLGHALAQGKSLAPIPVTNTLAVRASEEQADFHPHDHLPELAPQTTSPLDHGERRSS
ncbi:MAG: hypothetical protein ABIO24_12600 [Saprospiraceae bacterium]